MRKQHLEFLIQIGDRIDEECYAVLRLVHRDLEGGEWENSAELTDYVLPVFTIKEDCGWRYVTPEEFDILFDKGNYPQDSL